MAYTFSDEQKSALEEMGITKKMLKHSKNIKYKGGYYVEPDEKAKKSKSIKSKISSLIKKKTGKEQGKKIKFLETIKSCKNIDDIKKYQEAFNIKDDFIKELDKLVKDKKPRSFHNLFRFLKAYNEGSFPNIQKALHLYFRKDLQDSVSVNKISKIERLKSDPQRWLGAFNIDESKKDLTSENKNINTAKNYLNAFKKFDISKLKSYFYTIRKYIDWYANNMETKSDTKHKVLLSKVLVPLNKIDVKSMNNTAVATNLYEPLKLFDRSVLITSLREYHEPALINILIKIQIRIGNILKAIEPLTLSKNANKVSPKAVY